MFTDILKKYMNIFIIVLYVYILYSYDFKENIPLLLVVTGIFIYIIYNNKNGAFSGDIIEGGQDGPSVAPTDETTTAEATAGGDAAGGDAAGGDAAGGDAAGGDAAGGDAVGGDAAGGDAAGGGRSINLVDSQKFQELLDTVRELEGELREMDEEGTLGTNSNKISQLFNLYLEIDPNFSVNNIGGSMVTPNINVPELPSDLSLNGQPINLNLDLGNIKIPKDLFEKAKMNEMKKLKKRIRDLESKVNSMDQEEHVGLLQERIMDIEIENDKWEQKDIEESEENTDNLKARKVRHFAEYKTTTPMGMYDGLCFDHLKKENVYGLADESEVNTFLGTSIPLKVKRADNSKLENGPTVDGNENTPKRMNMLETNKTSISCCEDSPYLSNNGCVCLTSDQEDYLVNRGGNHVD